jgi:DNA-directed RNA polymerase specialized sigma subunit
MSLLYVDGLLMREAAKVLGVTESRISQIHAAAVRALREALALTLQGDT